MARHLTLAAVLCGSLAAGRMWAAPDAAQAELRKKLDAAKAYAEAKYSIASWNELRAAMFSARATADNAAATPEQVQAASTDVQQKIAALKERAPLPDTSPHLALSASPYATARTGAVNNVALRWAAADPQDGFELLRAAGQSGSFARVYAGPSTSFEDGPLPDGTYTYKLLARRGNNVLTAGLAQATTTPMPAGVEEYSNQTGKGFALGSPVKAGDTLYRFPGKRDGLTLAINAETSTDGGKTWQEGPVVLDRTSHPDLEDYKLEAGTIFYDKKHDQIVWWAHWERAKGYGAGRVFVATAKPGERFTVHHIYTPFGVQARDLSIFADDDGQHYLVSASNVPGQGVNATVYIFRLNDECTDVTGIVNKVQEGQTREAPGIIKADGFYYLFSSQNAGWFPSRGTYVSARALDGRWSEPRSFADSSTFSTQSGPIMNYRDGTPPAYLFTGSRWVRAEGTSPSIAVPIKPVDGFVFGDYAPTVLYEPARSRFIPVQNGSLLSQNRPAVSSVPGAKGGEADKAFDGNYATSFHSDARTWPFSVTTDLGAACRVRNVQISWHIHNGSEAYYKYTVDGSPDGRQWRVLLDRTNDQDPVVSKTYGFSSDLLPDAPEARYVRITVQRAVLRNNSNNWYPVTLEEVKVYGDRR